MKRTDVHVGMRVQVVRCNLGTPCVGQWGRVFSADALGVEVRLDSGRTESYWAKELEAVAEEAEASTALDGETQVVKPDAPEVIHTSGVLRIEPAECEHPHLRPIGVRPSIFAAGILEWYQCADCPKAIQAVMLPADVVEKLREALADEIAEVKLLTEALGRVNKERDELRDQLEAVREESINVYVGAEGEQWECCHCGGTMEHLEGCPWADLPAAGRAWRERQEVSDAESL